MCPPKTVIAIVGPTGSGKTELSVRLAKYLDAEIISCDSMQVYKGMDIGTAKITKEEMCGVKHHLIDVLEPYENYSVSDFCHDAKCVADDIFSRGKCIVMVGGTGLYVDSFIKDIDFTETGSSDEIRRELGEYAKDHGAPALHAMLESFDPESARAIHPNNQKRVIRAIEYYRLTGETISEHNKRTKEKPSPYNYIYFGISRPRQELYERIDKRVDIMMEQGLLDEVFALWKKGLSEKHTSMQALGYKEFLWYIKGKSTLDESVRILKRDSRHYAKRQLTWFGRNSEMHWLDLSGNKPGEDALEEAKNILRQNGVIS
ncbi:MAG: tRNA (adenosine(37)-N6)-dimethylallyltransferase MiaA [Clostridia bacterium]|nr:tRNA (adenosine(37)-N6)-dimethylallyltransferase MiaA [Clostridia bacterium]